MTQTRVSQPPRLPPPPSLSISSSFEFSYPTPVSRTSDSFSDTLPREAHSLRAPLPSPDVKPTLSPGWDNSAAVSPSRPAWLSSFSSSTSSSSLSLPPLPNPYAPETWRDRDNDRSSQSPPINPSPRMQDYSFGSMSYTGPPTFGGGLGAAFPEFLPQPQLGMQPQSTSLDWRPETPRAQIGPAEYAQALEIAKHIRAALPHIRAVDALGPPAGGQPYRSILDLASTAVGVLSGCAPKPTPQRTAPHAQPEAKRTRVSNGDKDKPATYCRGCGATETPEWRRGPLGPRTLCNACGLVHMKMMRKRKKAEEKAAADAAAKN